MSVYSLTANRKIIINSLKKALLSLPKNDMELISRINTTSIDLVPRASVLTPLYLSKDNEKVKLFSGLFC